jgi:hypothetical protein
MFCICDSKPGVIKNVPVALLPYTHAQTVQHTSGYDKYYAKSSKTAVDGYQQSKLLEVT